MSHWRRACVCFRKGRDFRNAIYIPRARARAAACGSRGRLRAAHPHSAGGHPARPRRARPDWVRTDRHRQDGRHLHVSAAAVYGGVEMEPQTRALRHGVDIVVATPGRLLDHMERGHVDFSRLEVLVLDEADRMLDMGFAPDVRRILRALPAKRQTMLFSATVSLEVDALARTALDSHASVEIGRRAKPAEGIEHVIVAV